MKITLSFPPCGTDIPYFDATEFDPSERHEYVDLCANPGGVDDLPEIINCPQFKEFLLAINGAGTIFRSFGCNFVLFPEETIETDDQPQTIGTAEVHSYVHVGFADLARCEHLDDYFRLCGRLSKHLSEQAEFQSPAVESDREVDNKADDADDATKADHFHVDLSIESLRMENQDKGHVLAISCHVQGWTPDEAKRRWSQLMGVVSAFLAREQLER